MGTRQPLDERSKRFLAGLGLVFAVPFALWGLFVGGMLLGASIFTLWVPALLFGVLPSLVAYKLFRVIFPPR